MKQLRVMVVDDHEVVRIGLRALLSRQPELAVVGEAADATGAIEEALRLRPDIVVMDIRLGGSSGIDACRTIVKQATETRVIMLTSYAEDELIFDAIEAGAAGYVLKQVGSQSLIAAIEAVGNGQSLIDPTLVDRVFNRVRESVQRQRHEHLASLSSQEVRIMALLSKGKANREIAGTLGLGEKTVRNYVSNILSKLHLVNRSEAAVYAVQHHLVDAIDYSAEPPHS